MKKLGLFIAMFAIAGTASATLLLGPGDANPDRVDMSTFDYVAGALPTIPTGSSTNWGYSGSAADVPTVASGNLVYANLPASFQGLEISESTTNALFVDSITVSDTSDEPDPDDEDGDGLPDSWEITHYGSTNVNPNATASNGINTVRQAYIAGLDPTNAQSRFLISELSPQASASVLSWVATSGRVYTIYWSSNLLSGFQSLETNVPWTNIPYSDTNHTAEEKGFYKIEVGLEE